MLSERGDREFHFGGAKGAQGSFVCLDLGTLRIPSKIQYQNCLRWGWNVNKRFSHDAMVGSLATTHTLVRVLWYMRYHVWFVSSISQAPRCAWSLYR